MIKQKVVIEIVRSNSIKKEDLEKFSRLWKELLNRCSRDADGLEA